MVAVYNMENMLNSRNKKWRAQKPALIHKKSNGIIDGYRHKMKLSITPIHGDICRRLYVFIEVSFTQFNSLAFSQAITTT